jgi:hypothetical protein
MPTGDSPSQALDRVFRRHSVVDLGVLFDALGTRSRMTVFRRLKDRGYLSSFSHAGRYYTLEDIPRFDEHGLWFFQGIGFSRLGTLKKTVALAVSSSEAGRTHGELEAILKLRVHNTLLDLERRGCVSREAMGRLSLYLSPDPEMRQEQIARRRVLRESAVRAAPLSPLATIEVLAEAVRTGGLMVAPAVVAERLRAREVMATAAEVEEVLSRHGLAAGKKSPE